MRAPAGFSSLQIRVRAANSALERAGHFAVRRSVFVGEQHLFAETDRDGRDDDPSTIHLIGEADDRIIGAVRIYPIGGRERWQGDRLAVMREHRTTHVGADLVQLAVRTASQQGGQVMEAHVQVANVHFFEYLGWQLHGSTEMYVGALHQPMIFDLTRCEVPKNVGESEPSGHG
jgi:putative N-acetyltransferase (TIGR04045 family)